MSDKTPNHELNLYQDGDENWTHTPDMETIEERLIVRDLEENRDDYMPYEDALFFARDSETWYVGDGTLWEQLGSIGGSIDTTKTDGIANNRDHVGAFHDGGYHDNTSNNDPRWSLRFWAAKDLSLHSVVIDADLSNVQDDTFDIELREWDDVNSESTHLDSVSVTVVDGPDRYDLSGLADIPSDGEYLLSRTRTHTNDEVIPLRRIKGWDGWKDYSPENTSREDIDLLGAVHATEDQNFDNDWRNNYYYFFDIEIGESTTQVTSPWSHDVEEIYMRPRDPAEEFDDVSPRSLWIDTS